MKLIPVHEPFTEPAGSSSTKHTHSVKPPMLNHMTQRLISLVMGALLPLALSAHAETLLLRGATVHTVAKGTLTPGDVLVRDGKIAAVAPRIDQAADRT